MKECHSVLWNEIHVHVKDKCYKILFMPNHGTVNMLNLWTTENANFTMILQNDKQAVLSFTALR